MSTIAIQDARLSFIYTESNTAILAASRGEATPCGFAGNESEYNTMFDLLQQSGPVIIDNGICVRTPWHVDPTLDNFWQFYCDNVADPGAMKGSTAWHMLVPIQRIMPGRIALASPPAVVEGVPDAARPNLWGSVHGFLHAFGIAVVVTFTYRNGPSLSLGELIALGIHLRSEKLQVEIEAVNGAAGMKNMLRLDEIAKRALKRLREDTLGAGAAVGHQSKEPFSVVTIVEAEGVDPAVAPQQGGEIHEALEALAGWDLNYKLTLPKTIDERRIESKGTAIAGDIIYAAKRGRVVWFPSKFTKKGKLQRGLSCYHRNLTYLSMQVAMLSEFARDTTSMLDNGTFWMNFSTAHRTRGKRAVAILGTMYGKSDHTYRSLSPRRQIDDSYHHEIDVVRKAGKMDLLKENPSDDA